jgi:hypothetical protein
MSVSGRSGSGQARRSDVPQPGKCRGDRVLAAGKQGSPELDEFEDAVVLWTFGDAQGVIAGRCSNGALQRRLVDFAMWSSARLRSW